MDTLWVLKGVLAVLIKADGSLYIRAMARRVRGDELGS